MQSNQIKNISGVGKYMLTLNLLIQDCVVEV